MICWIIACHGALSNVNYLYCEKSYIVPLQLLPSITNPSLHWQLCDPSVFLHSELGTILHGLTCVAHSSISLMRECDMNVLLYRHECFTGKYTTRKIHTKPHPGLDSSGVFSISLQVKASMISMNSSLSLKLYLNSLVYHQNIFGSSSEVFGNPRYSSIIIGSFGKCSETLV